MRGRTRTKTFLAFALGAAFLTVPSMAEGQRGTQQGRLRSLGPSVDLLESALQTGDEIGLTPEQRARLEELQTEFLERPASARELVDAQRAQLREEMERLRSEREEAVAELRAMLTEEQVRQLQSVAREQRLGPRRYRARFRSQSRRQSFRSGDGTFRPRSFRRGPAGRFSGWGPRSFPGRGFRR